jgi:hypothetical protein
MSETRKKLLKAALILFGLIFTVGLFGLLRIWPSGWVWTPEQPEYLQMILSFFVVLGLFLLNAARDPLAHRSLIWFTIWSSAAHGGVMAVHAIIDPTERAHLFGDIPALFVVAIVLAALMPRKAAAPELESEKVGA